MQLVIALLLGLSLIIFFILRSRIQVFPALIIGAILIGLFSGMPAAEIMNTISTGFGKTLSSIGIIIGLGVMMGKTLEVTGGAEKMTSVILKFVGIERTELVLMLSGWLISIPVFADSGFVILSELAKEFSRTTKKSMVKLGCCLGAGLYLTHHLVPPTPGPLGVAAILNLDIGRLIIWGIILTILTMPVTFIFIKWVSKKNTEIIPEMTVNYKKKDKELPNGIMSFLPIVVPVVLILINTISAANGVQNSAVTFLGHPIVAVLIGTLIAIYGLTKNFSREEVIKSLENSLADAGLIMCITGAGGALGAVLRISGTGDYIASIIVKSNFPAILLPMLIAIVIKISQGSGTVSMITTASILAPMISGLKISPLITTLAICSGSQYPSIINDSFFWVVTKFSGMDVKTGLKSWSTTTCVMGLTSSIIVYILSFIL